MREVRFFEGRWHCFSNSSSDRVHWRNNDYMTSQHAYQSAKFVGNPVTREAVRLACSAHDAKNIARKNDGYKADNWQEIRLGIREEITRAKMERHTYIQEKLLETGNMEIICDSMNPFWGRGPDGKGLNHMGKIWMKLREELKSQTGK